MNLMKPEMQKKLLEMFTFLLLYVGLETNNRLTLPLAMRMSLVVLFFSFKQTFLNGDVHMSQILSKNKSDKNIRLYY